MQVREGVRLPASRGNLLAMALLSVVVTITSGADHTARCLQALSEQLDAPPTETSCPYGLVWMMRFVYAAIGRAFDSSTCLTSHRPSRGSITGSTTAGGAVGLCAARGEVIAMTEDHAIPGPRWCATIWDEHFRHPYGAIGSGVSHVGKGLLNWAVYYCDYARYQPPFPPSFVQYVTDINVSYKRAALEACRDVWQNFYDELRAVKPDRSNYLHVVGRFAVLSMP